MDETKKIEINEFTVNITKELVPSSLLTQAKAALGQEFQIIDVGSYFTVLHHQYGAAAVVSSDNAAEAEKAAAHLTTVLRQANLSMKALPFAVSETGVKPPIVVRSGPQLATDIAITMARAAGPESVISAQAMVTLQVLLNDARKAMVKKTPRIDPQILTIIEAAARKVIGTTPIYTGGSSIEIEEIAGPEFLLPALLVSAMQTWAIPVAGRKGKGGFLIDLTPDSSAVLMYKVSGIETSSPLLLFLPVVNVLRRQKRAGEFILDDCITRFGNFMTTNDLYPDFLRDMSGNPATPDGTE
jgi:hypothetical protein